MRYSIQKSRMGVPLVRVLLALLSLILGYLLLHDHLAVLLVLLRAGDREGMARYLAAQGNGWGALLIAALQLIQVVGVVFPSTPIQLAAGAVLGILPGVLACEGGYLVGNLLVFAVLRWVGKRRHILPPGRMGRLRRWMDRAHPGWMVLLASLLPLVPNGLIPYVAAQTALPMGSFALAVSLGSLPGILGWCAVGSILRRGDWGMATGLLLLFGGMAILFYRWRARWMVLLTCRWAGKSKAGRETARPAWRKIDAVDGAMSEDVEDQGEQADEEDTAAEDEQHPAQRPIAAETGGDPAGKEGAEDAYDQQDPDDDRHGITSRVE